MSVSAADKNPHNLRIPLAVRRSVIACSRFTARSAVTVFSFNRCSLSRRRRLLMGMRSRQIYASLECGRRQSRDDVSVVEIRASLTWA